MATLNISLPDEMRAHIESQVKSGRYANASDFIRDLIRQNQTEVDAIRVALLEGEQSGVSELKVKDVIRSRKRRNA